MTPIVIDNWKDFARVMIETKDLDPTYPILRHLTSTRGEAWCGRFLLHYLWFYNLRDAIRAADETNDGSFWARCRTDGLGTDVKRRGARRHFRADNALRAINAMQCQLQSPWDIIQDMYRPEYHRMVEHIERCYKGCQVGPYYIWKLMDWYDICLDWPVHVSMDDAIKYLPDVPRKTALETFPDQNLRETLTMVNDFVKQFDHPVKEGHKCGLGETETVICTIKGYLQTKKHWIGEDIADAHMLLSDLPEVLASAPAKIPYGTYIRGEYRDVT